MWEIVCAGAGSDEEKKYLADGWEPFTVTVQEGLEAVVWFRKEDLLKTSAVMRTKGESGKAQKGSTSTEIILDFKHIPPEPVSIGYYLTNQLLFITGDNEGYFRVIVYSNKDRVKVACPFPNEVAQGDEYIIEKQDTWPRDVKKQ